MKKTLIALAALAATGAFAQSTVTISGNVGFGYQSVDSSGLPAQNAAGNAAATTSSGTNRGLAMTDATLAFTAVEDLGGGMKAMANMTFDTGGSTFNTAGNFNRRNTSVGVSGGFGSISMANTRSSDLITQAFVAPASLSDGIYDNSGVVWRGPIDVLTYVTPDFGGFKGNLSYVESGATAAGVGGNPALYQFGGQGDGNTSFTTITTVLGLTYANGPLAAGLSFKTSTYDSRYPVASANIARNTNSEGFITYDFGVAKVGLGFDSAMAGTDNTAAAAVRAVNDATAWSFGVAAPIGAFTVGVNWAQRDVNNMYEAVVNYDLSKRTAINLSFGRQSYDASIAGGALGGSETNGNQYRIRLLHAF